MLELYNLGISEDEIKLMIEQCSEILMMDASEIVEKVELLESIGCSNSQIKNIITCNPCYLSRFNEDIIKLFGKLIEIGIDSLELLFDSNPFLLNIDAFEIDEYIIKGLDKGLVLESIIDEIWCNPSIMDDI